MLTLYSRSVAISGGSSAPTLGGGLRFGSPPALKSFSGIQKPALGIARPPSLGFSKPATGLGRAGSVGKARRSGEQIYNVKQEWSGASAPSTWDIKGEDLEMVPWEFPLERTHREIEQDASCVATRISDCLRKLSVEAEFDSEKAKAKCKTSDYVMFRIRLFAGGENGQPVVVEVQRRSGSSSSFMRTCRAVLNAAEGVETAISTAPFGGRGPPMGKRSISSMKCLASVIPKRDDYEAEAQSALKKVQEMFRSGQQDSNILGLENLCQLTDPLKTNANISMIVSKSIILSEDDKADIREEIRLLTERDVFPRDVEEEGPSTHAEHMRHLALCVLANCLSLCSQDKSLEDAMQSQNWFADSLLPSLLEELKRASVNMNNACKAASCLHCMMKCSSTISIDNGCVAILEKALQVGSARHELLASEAQQCLNCANRLE